MYPILPSLPAFDDAGAPRIVLRDGSVVSVRATTEADAVAMKQFFEGLSPESHYQRFFTASHPSTAVIEALTDSSDRARNLTLIAERSIGGETRIIAVASYSRLSPGTAEAAFAVADPFQGKGLGTALLERLAAVAASAGVERFQATTLSDNTQMLEVFRDSGFEIHSRSSGGSVNIQLSLVPSARAIAAEEERDRLATTTSLRPVLEPRTVAVIGASSHRSNIGRRVLDAIVSAGFRGSVHVVHPRVTEIAGVAAYRSARDLPAGVDLAIVAVPAPNVLSVVDDCATSGVKALVIISAGFAEAGAEGRRLQQQLADKVRACGMRMVGPNCMGLLNASQGVRLNASFSPIFPRGGAVALSSQSGALGLAILEIAVGRGLGLSSFVSVGNKADVSGNDLLQYWEGDAATRVILLYLESFGNPRRFARLARRISRHKPIVAVKSGRTRDGSRAASSHTAAMAASDVAVDALFRQCGVVRADTLDEMFDVAACLDLQPLPAGRRLAIVTNAGGPGILAVDACGAAGLTLAAFSLETATQLAAGLPTIASRNNPVDMIASAGPDEYRRTIETVLAAPETDSLIVLYTPIEVASTREVLDGIGKGVAAGRQAGASSKPVLACLMTTSDRSVPLEVGEERIPTYLFPENAVRALGKVTAYAMWRAVQPGLLWGFEDLQIDSAREVCRDVISQRGEGWLADSEVHRVLSSFGLPLAPSALARDRDEAVALAAVMGYPVVAKLSSRRVQHKTDLGAVRLNLTDASSVQKAFSDILAAGRRVAPADAIDGILVQPMLTGGVETIMGIVQDPLFGPLIGFGLGGVHVEILGDVRFRIAPLTDRDVDELLHEIKGFPLLEGYRGHPAADLDALRELLLRLSRLADEVPEIAELDLNPVIALPPGRGCRVVDARIRVRPTGPLALNARPK